MWLLDLCLIFGLCTPKAHVEPEVLEDYSTMGESHSWNTGPQTIVRGIGSYEDYCDALERKKKELHRPMPWASDNSSKQIQDLNELSEQQTFYEGIASTDSLNLEMLPFETSVISGLPNEASGAMSSPFITDHDNADAIHLQFSGFITPPVVALAPPPHPRTKWEYSPSPIIQGSTSTPIPPSATPPSCTLHEISSQHEATSVYACYTLSTSPPSCVESSSDSSCYVSNSTQQGYLPNFVNIAARNEQKQYSRRVNGSPPGSVVPTESPLHIPNRQSPSISRSRDEAQRYSQIKNEAKQRNQLNSLSLSPFNHNGPCFLAADTTSSSGLESPRSSLKSFLSNNQLEQNQSPYTPTQQIQGQEVREPMMTTRQNSKLSVMALKNNFHNISVSSSIKSIENDGNK
ncbi:hypothetical protein BGZ46_001520 [Entomortierella lignicola]|nr:hypothetical protein BGZ46_001520 [Entomortierella lignicola]